MTRAQVPLFEGARLTMADSIRLTVASLAEAACLRGFGGTKTFREFMRLFADDDRSGPAGAGIPFRFVATACPAPNDFIELLAYAAYLGIMDVGEAKTRFFKRNSEKADSLTIHPHKEREFWLWVASWAIFVQKPSDLGFSDEGYELPPLEVRWHEVATDHANAGAERDGQGRMFKNAALGVVDASREKRESLGARVAKMLELRAAEPDEHRIIWHDLEAERYAIEAAVPGVRSVYGSQDLDERDATAGLGTVPYCALKLRRRAIGIELSARYFADAAGYCEQASRQVATPTLFDLIGAEPETAA